MFFDTFIIMPMFYFSIVDSKITASLSNMILASSNFWFFMIFIFYFSTKNLFLNTFSIYLDIFVFIFKQISYRLIIYIKVLLAEKKCKREGIDSSIYLIILIWFLIEELIISKSGFFLLKLDQNIILFWEMSCIFLASKIITSSWTWTLSVGTALAEIFFFSRKTLI